LNFPVHGSSHGVYFFVIEGSARVANIELKKRDGLGAWETRIVPVRVSRGSRILAITVPMS